MADKGHLDWPGWRALIAGTARAGMPHEAAPTRVGPAPWSRDGSDQKTR